MARQGWPRQASAGCVTAWQAWFGMAGRGAARQGAARQARFGLAGRGAVRRGRPGEARLGEARHGGARHGGAGTSAVRAYVPVRVRGPHEGESPSAQEKTPDWHRGPNEKWKLS